MKKIIMFAAACILFSGISYAQSGKEQHRQPANQGFHKKHNEFSKLNLTPDQRKQMRSINQDYQKQATALRAQNSITLGDYKKQLAALQTQRKEKTMQLLNDKQKDQVAQMKQKKAEDLQVKQAARLERMKLRLNLSDSQVAKIKDQQSAFRTQAKAIWDNTNLPNEDKRDQFRALMMQNKDKINSVLTPDQIQKIQQQKKEGSGRQMS